MKFKKNSRRFKKKDKRPDDDTSELKSKPKRFEMMDDKIEEMERIRVQKMENDTSLPTNTEEFEKALLKGPNNIEMWIQYMSWVFEN